MYTKCVLVLPFKHCKLTPSGLIFKVPGSSLVPSGPLVIPPFTFEMLMLEHLKSIMPVFFIISAYPWILFPKKAFSEEELCKGLNTFHCSKKGKVKRQSQLKVDA